MTISCHCFERLAKMRDAVPVNNIQEDIFVTHINPSGYYMRILTIKYDEDTRVVISEEEHTNDSFFPGWNWRFMYCHNCNDQIGWFFSPVNKDDKNAPYSFMGFWAGKIVTDNANVSYF